MVFFQPPAAGGVVAPSSGRGVLKADPTDPGTAELSRAVCTVTACGSWVGDSGARRLQRLPLGGRGRAVLWAAWATLAYLIDGARHLAAPSRSRGW